MLAKSASQAGCAIHLGIVHIEESGAAEPQYDQYSSRSRWRDYGDDDDEDDDDEDYNEDFEIIDVCDTNQYIDSWVNLQNCPVDFGELPIEEGELLPAGALDDENPDEQRLMEATGNEGASYERSYHRAALIIWRQDKYINVLLQSGINAAMTYFEERVKEGHLQMSVDAWLTEMRRLAGIILDTWASTLSSQDFLRIKTQASRAEMLKLLVQLKDAKLIECFISTILTLAYDGTENDALMLATDLLNSTQMICFSELFSKKMGTCSAGCIHLFSLLVQKEAEHKNPVLRKALETLAHTLVGELKALGPNPLIQNRYEFYNEKRTETINSTALVELWEALEILDIPSLREKMIAECIAHHSIFQPRTILSPALAERFRKKGPMLCADTEFLRLWQHAATFLLTANEYPPKIPSDWRQNVNLSCTCAECKELQTFAQNPTAQVYRFRMNEERRKHLENMISLNRLDMQCTTERSRSPYTLVSTKMRSAYEQACKEYQHDIVAMQTLVPLYGKMLEEPLGDSHISDTQASLISSIAPLHLRLTQAIARLKK